MAATNRAKNRAIRQEALRKQLGEQCRLQHVLENIRKMEEQGASMTPQELHAIRAANEQRLKLLNKYLPDLKAIELGSSEDGLPVVTIRRYFDGEAH